MRYVEQYGLSAYDAGVLTAERSTAEFFEDVVKGGGEPKRVCNWITQDGLRLANERGCSVRKLGITPQQVAKLTSMIVSGDISSTAATSVTNIMTTRIGIDPHLIAKEESLLQKSDASELEKVVEQVLAENSKAVEDVKSGGKKNEKARSFLLGQVMQKTKGQANPKIVSEILSKKLN